MAGIIYSSAGSIRKVIRLHIDEFTRNVREIGRAKAVPGVSRVKSIGFGQALSVDMGTGVKSIRAVAKDISSTIPEASNPAI